MGDLDASRHGSTKILAVQLNEPPFWRDEVSAS